MALHTLGTNTTTSLQCLAAWAANLLAVDVASAGQAVLDDSAIATILGGWGFGATAVIGTGTTHSNTTLDTLVGVSGAPLSQIKLGDLVLGIGIPLGTFVVAIPSGTSVTLSNAATASAAGVNVIFARDAPPGANLDFGSAQLAIPKRGVLKVLPGDRVAVDNTGWPILISGASIGYAGSQWSFV